MLLLLLTSCYDIDLQGCQDLGVGQTITLTLEMFEGDDDRVLDEESDIECTWTTYGGDTLEIVPSENGAVAQVTAVAVGGTTLEVECLKSPGGREMSTCAIEVSEDPLEDLTGAWDASFEVTGANGPCSDEVGETRSETLTMTHDPDAGDLTIQGTSGLDTTGSFAGGELTYEGSFDEDGGLTETSVEATLQDGVFSGVERWTWTRGSDTEPTCAGTSSFTASR